MNEQQQKKLKDNLENELNNLTIGSIAIEEGLKATYSMLEVDTSINSINAVDGLLIALHALASKNNEIVDRMNEISLKLNL